MEADAVGQRRVADAVNQVPDGADLLQPGQEGGDQVGVVAEAAGQQALAGRRLPYERLDQLLNEVLMGVR